MENWENVAEDDLEEIHTTKTASTRTEYVDSREKDIKSVLFLQIEYVCVLQFNSSIDLRVIEQLPILDQPLTGIEVSTSQ